MARRILTLGLAALGLFLALPPMAAALEVQITLTWTAPGDDGWIGRAYLYDIRVSTAPITEVNFPYTAKVAGFLLPTLPGGKQSFVVNGLTAGRDYYFAIKTRDETGNWSKISNVAMWSSRTLDTISSAVALDFSAPLPNPARSQTSFHLALPGRERVEIAAFDLAGRRVRTLARGEQAPGTRDLIWNLTDDSGRRLAAGVYLVRAQLGDKAFTRRVTVVQ